MKGLSCQNWTYYSWTLRLLTKVRLFTQTEVTTIEVLVAHVLPFNSLLVGRADWKSQSESAPLEQDGLSNTLWTVSDG